ncbi:MAG TPA: FAD-dependent oxidoreductase, partial [Planctomycetota bacterium]|nr:FAD-dependent oxidoreductase [Planctomycetota bacterium]
MKIAVLGAGITGLTAAHRLENKGHEVHCFEATDRPGGLCQSETVDGFVADRAGGHIIFSKDREVLDFMLSVLGPYGYHTSERSTFIYYKGRYVQYPFENGLADLPKEETARCLLDYLEATFSRREGVPSPKDFESWCLWRFGASICELLMHPYNRKIWNVPLAELGTAWVEGRVPDAPMADVVNSALGLRREGYVHQSVFHYPMTGGFESMIRGVANLLRPGTLRLRCPVTELTRRDGGFSVNGESFDRVLSTIPLPVLGKLLGPSTPTAKRAFSALDHTSLVTVFLGLSKSDPPPHSWIYFPHEEDGPQNRITWLSNYSPKNAPEGCSSIMAEVTYYGEAPGSDEAITEQVISGLSAASLIQRNEVILRRTWHNPMAYILYRHGHEEHLAAVRDYASEMGIDLAGRFGNYQDFNSDRCIRDAWDVADRYAT